MKKIEFGFIQGRMTSPPSKKILQYFPKKNWKKEFHYAEKYEMVHSQEWFLLLPVV